jgi:signal transduction histidine kinase
MTFLGGVAHDLKNPLCALRMAVSGFEREEPQPEGHTRQTLELVGRQTTVLERMVGDFLDIARIEAGQLELHFETADLRELARAVAEMFRGWSALHPVELSLPDAPVTVRCDALRIEQAIVNLLSNAIKYSPEGGPVKVAVTLTDSEAVLAVGDRGIGIPPDGQRRIFEPFTRLGLSRESIPGAGLGLYIVQKIMVAHGGRVEVDSAPGVGSTFRLRLPRQRT